MDKDDEYIIDVEFKDDINTDVNNDHREPVYYNCMQVSKMLSEPDSRIRYWSKMFQPVLNIKTSNNVRRYTKTDIENLSFIKKLLKEDGLTIKQALEYCTEKGFDKTHALVDTSNPLAVKTFIASMSEEFHKAVYNMQQDLITQQKNIMQEFVNEVQEYGNNLKEEIKEDIIITTDNVISDKLDTLSNDINTRLDSIQKEIEETKKLNEMEDKLKNNMKNRKEDKDDIHWWSKIFKQKRH